MIGALGHRVSGAPGGLGELPCPDEDLAGHQERDQDVDGAVEVLVPADQVVLVAAIGVAGTVGVVLEDEDLAADPFFLETLLSPLDQAFQDSLKGQGMLLLVTILVIYLILGVLYESFIHPLTILSGLPSAGLGALATLLLFNLELNEIGRAHV